MDVMSESSTVGEHPTSGEIRTFLIADVRGYTQFTVEQGDEAAARLTQHFADLAVAVAAARDRSPSPRVKEGAVLLLQSSVQPPLHSAAPSHGTKTMREV